MASKFRPPKRGRGGFRRGNMTRKRPSSPDPPPQEPYSGYSDKDFDDIYLNAASGNKAKPYDLGDPPVPFQEPVPHGFRPSPQMHDQYIPPPNNSFDSDPIDYPTFPQHDFTEPIISLLQQDQFLAAAKEFESWCLNGECSPSDFNYLLNLVSATDDILVKLIESGHSLREFIDANRKEEDYRTLLLKEKCHAIESIFISCRVTKARWPLSSYELDRIEDSCQKIFKGIDFLKDILNPGNEQVVAVNHKVPEYFQREPDKPETIDLPRNETIELPRNNEGMFPSLGLFESSLCSVLSIALNTYQNGATVGDLVNYCSRNNLNVSQIEIEGVPQKCANLFSQRDNDSDLWIFNGFNFLSEVGKK